MQTKITSHILYLVGYLRFAMKIHHKRHRSTRVGHRTSKDLAATKKWHGSLTYPWKIITFNKYIIYSYVNNQRVHFFKDKTTGNI